MSTREAGLTAPAVPRGRDYVAALGTALLAAQLLLAPVLLACAVALVAAARLGRGRLGWLAAPAGAGLILIVAAGARSALAGFGAWPAHLAGYLAGATRQHPAGRVTLAATAAADLPRQLPVALLAGSAQAAAFARLRRGGGDGTKGPRPGLVAAVSGRRVTATLRAGRTATAFGCTLGVAIGTGRPAGLTWTEAERGVLACGPDEAAVTAVCVPVTCAALRRRKSVVVADLTRTGLAAAAAHGLARSLGVPAGGREAGLAAELPLVLGQVIRDRTAYIARSPAIAAELAWVLTGVRDLGLRADALVWIHGCDRADPAALRKLIALGGEAGCSVLLSTSSARAASELIGAAGVVLAAGPAGPGIAGQLAALGAGDDPASAARVLAGQPARNVTIIGAGRPQLQLRAVPIEPVIRR